MDKGFFISFYNIRRGAVNYSPIWGPTLDENDDFNYSLQGGKRLYKGDDAL